MKLVCSHQHPAAACFRVISDLHREIQLVEAELLLVRLRLAQCRARSAAVVGAAVASDSHLLPVCVNYPEKEYRREYDFPPPSLPPNVEDPTCIELEVFDANEEAFVDSFDANIIENNELRADGESISEMHDPKNATSLLTLPNSNGHQQRLDEYL